MQSNPYEIEAQVSDYFSMEIFSSFLHHIKVFILGLCVPLVKRGFWRVDLCESRKYLVSEAM